LDAETPKMTQAAVPGVPAKATQGTEARHREIGWAEASIWTDRMVSALANGLTGGKWFSLADKVIRPSTLEAAWRQVARNKGAAGVDGQSVERFAAAAERYLSELHQTVKTGRYRPSPVKRVDIPKSGGGTRPLGIPTVKSLPRAKAGDRIVQTALKMAIEPIPQVRPVAGPRTCFEAEFHAGSYGFRPGRGCKSLPSRKRGARCGKSRDC
jgi:RNA-directed DNA polymerase